MTVDELRAAVEARCVDERPDRDAAMPVIDALLSALESGRVRAAERGAEGWQAVAWVKAGILLAFRVGRNRATRVGEAFAFRDRDTFPTLDAAAGGRDVRVVPGGTTIRRGAYLGDGVVVMPPAYVNVGAHVGRGSMIDSHALVGSCAQVGSGVHVSAAAQLGGVLEPIGALPVIVEDGAFVGGGCGVYEGARVGAGAVLAPGVILSRSIPVLDLVHERELRAGPDGALVIPERAVVVPGTRRAAGAWAAERGVHLQAPVIVKYRDPGTDAVLALEGALR